MPLPTINHIVSAANPGGLTPALLNHPIVTGANDTHAPKEGHLQWNGNNMQISGVGVVNYCYIPAVQDEVSYGVVDCGPGGGDFYVVSDRYGGCEYHELYNQNFNMLAFLHIYRGGGGTTAYTPAAGWVLRSAKRSAVIARRNGMAGSNWSVSLVDRNNNPPPVQSKFIHVRDMALPHVFGQPMNASILTVLDEDNGDTEYGFNEAGFMNQTYNKVWSSIFG